MNKIFLTLRYSFYTLIFVLLTFPNLVQVYIITVVWEIFVLKNFRVLNQIDDVRKIPTKDYGTTGHEYRAVGEIVNYGGV